MTIAVDLGRNKTKNMIRVKNKCHLEGTVYFPKHMLKLMGKTIHTNYNFMLNFFGYLDLSICYPTHN